MKHRTIIQDMIKEWATESNAANETAIAVLVGTAQIAEAIDYLTEGLEVTLGGGLDLWQKNAKTPCAHCGRPGASS